MASKYFTECAVLHTIGNSNHGRMVEWFHDYHDVPKSSATTMLKSINAFVLWQSCQLQERDTLKIMWENDVLQDPTIGHRIPMI